MWGMFSVIRGHDREPLDTAGHVEMIAAGRWVGMDGWLVAICADAPSEPLLDLDPLLCRSWSWP